MAWELNATRTQDGRRFTAMNADRKRDNLEQFREDWQTITWEAQGVKMTNGRFTPPCFVLWTPAPLEPQEIDFS